VWNPSGMGLFAGFGIVLSSEVGSVEKCGSVEKFLS
jgi:hypothetical protein